MPITTAQDLRDHIDLAIRVELATVPPYLFAMYSLVDQESLAALLIKSIVAEEMLHAVLATNLLLAVGGEPRFDTTDYIPSYPGLLPHHQPPMELNLAPCSTGLIRDVFMRIEQPEIHGAPAEPDNFESLGQFYHALERAIEGLAATSDLFAEPQRSRQLADPSFYTPVQFDAEDSGGLAMVDSPESARDAIEVIVHQGEGLSTDRWADPSHQELTHYHKLLQIADGSVAMGGVIGLAVNPRSADYPAGLAAVSDLFNASYRAVFLTMDDLFGPTVDKAPGVARLYRLMMNVMAPVARFLVTQPLPERGVAAPTFETYRFSSESWLIELGSLSAAAAAVYPELGDVAAAVAEL